MSLILDALKKAETERNGDNAIPSIETVHYDVDAEDNTETPHWKWFGAAAIVAIIVICALAWLLTPSSPTESTGPQELAKTTQRQSQTKTSSTDGIKKSMANTTHSTQNIKASEFTPPADHISQAAKIRKEKALAAQKNIIANQYKEHNKSEDTEIEKADASIEKLYKKAEPKKQASNTRKPADTIKDTAAETQSTQTNPELIASYPNIRLLKELPFSVQENVPTMIYSQHNHKEGGASSIEINGKKYRERSSIGGVRVERILEDGVLMKYQQHEFKMLALNSWLNY